MPWVWDKLLKNFQVLQAPRLLFGSYLKKNLFFKTRNKIEIKTESHNKKGQQYLPLYDFFQFYLFIFFGFFFC